MAASGTQCDTENFLPLECVWIACDRGMVADRVRLPMGAPQQHGLLVYGYYATLSTLRNGFESRTGRQDTSLLSSVVEHRLDKAVVVGSIPTAGTKNMTTELEWLSTLTSTQTAERHFRSSNLLSSKI